MSALAPTSDILQPMLEPSSVAIVGASPRAGSVGHHLVRQLLGGGYAGSVHLVNPGHPEIDGIACLPSLEAAGRVDLAVLAVANHRLEEQLSVAIETGAGAVAIFSSCVGEASDGTPLAHRLRTMAVEAGVPICGGNGMGFVHVERSLRVTGWYQPWELVPGGITFLSHSGSLFSAMLHNHRQLRFNLVVSCGNELTTTMDRYLAYALERPSTRAVGMFVEAVRDPIGMAAALTQADALDIPVVALKVGRTERSRAAVATHSDAIAGDHAGFAAFARAHGVHVVETPEEMMDTLQLMASPRRAAPGGVGSVHDSGGERSLFIDLAARERVPLATLGADTRRRIAAVLDPGLEADNPVDAWGTGHGFDDVFGECLDAIAADDGVGVVVLSVDLTPEEQVSESYGRVAVELARRVVTKPVVVLSNLAGAVDPVEAGFLADHGVPLLRGTASGLRAIRHALDRRDRAGLAPVVVGAPPPSLEDWRRRLLPGGALSETEALDLLAGFGLPTVARKLVASLSEAEEAARRIGFPVALKTAMGIAHKTEVDGVHLSLETEEAVSEAYARLSRLGPHALVQAMAPGGVEVAMGLVRDEQFGTFLVLGAGGVLVEHFDDLIVMRGPLDRVRALRAIESLRVSSLLDGWRGSPPADREALAAAIVSLSDLAFHLGDRIQSLDINPLIAHAGGCVAVDALVVSRPG
jgi:acetate---CoA ligase (ADP-forming)